jgi:simple sugar transport system ATP-binding protein
MDTEKKRTENNRVLTMTGIGKSFPGVRALHQVDFTLRRGEIHAVMGENGAGKSTLIKVLTGVYPMDEGSVEIEEKPVQIASPQDAHKCGISTVYQEVNLCPNLTVAENLYLGREPRSAGLISWRKMYANAAALLRELNISAVPAAQLDTCSIAIQQMIAIARAVSVHCKVLILDEPTSSLDADEVQKLFALMRQLKKQGVGIIFVTHFLDQVYEVCDRITVLRNGELVGEYTVENLPRLQLVAKMMGKDLEDLANLKVDNNQKEGNTPANDVPLVDARDVSSGFSRVAPFNLTMRAGEVVGFSGLLGSGRSELVRAIYGADKAVQGKLFIKGEHIKIRKPLDAMRRGMAYLPEDRKVDGIISELSVRENIIIALQAKRGLFRRLSRKEMEQFADEYIRLLSIKTASRDTPIKSLSGGNQQKVILARWLLTNPEFMILDEPTRGIDIGTKTEIQKLIIKLASEGKSVVFISSELEEMLRTCSRMVVMRDRKKVGELTGADLNQETIMRTIAGGERGHS